MWSKTLCRSSFTLKRYSDSSYSRYVQLYRCLSGRHQNNGSSDWSHDHDRQTRYNRHLTAVLAGLGVSLAAYKIFERSSVIHAAESAPPENKNVEENGAENTATTESKTDPKTEGKNKNDAKKEEIDWSKVPKVPKHVTYLLIGGGVASLEAFIAIKTKDPKAKVLMIGDEPYTPYIRPPLSKSFWFDKNKENYKEKKYTSLLGKEKNVFLYDGLYMSAQKLPYSERGGLAWHQGKVVNLDAVNKKATLQDGTVIAYDKCLIATGGKPKNLRVIEEAGTAVQKRVTLFRNLDDMIKLIETTDKCKSVAVIGGGFLGSELAVGLATRGEESGLKVYQVFPESAHMSKVLPDYLSKWTSEKIKEEGVEVVPKSDVESVAMEKNQVKLCLNNDRFITVDHVVVAVGIEPNTDLARSAGLELDETHGGYKVNMELQARSGIWVAGDCSCFFDVKLGRRRVEHYDHACLTGRLAGFNMAGESRPYTHQSAYWSDLGRQISYEAVGLTDSKLKTFSVFTKSVPQVENTDKAKEQKSDNKQPEQSKEASTTKDPKSSTPVKSPTPRKKSPPAKTNSDKKTKTKTKPSVPAESVANEYNIGIVFYLKNDIIVGIVLWNLSGYTGEPTRLDIARQVIANGKKNENLVEVAKLFNIYESS